MYGLVVGLESGEVGELVAEALTGTSTTLPPPSNAPRPPSPAAPAGAANTAADPPGYVTT
jgi:hypothetical protein